MAGIIVDHKESGVRYAISESNYNSKVHKKVRDLKPGETILGYQPKAAPTKADDKADDKPADTTTQKPSTGDK